MGTEVSRDSQRDDPRKVTLADKYVGAKIRELRTLLGITQKELAAAIGTTYQQSYKYEHGLNRISIGTLYNIASYTGFPVSWFFEGLDKSTEEKPPLSHRRAILDLVRNFNMIQNSEQQEALWQIASFLAASAHIKPKN